MNALVERLRYSHGNKHLIGKIHLGLDTIKGKTIIKAHKQGA